MKKIKIYCMAHKAYKKIEDSNYIPLQVGASLHEGFGILKDNEGENISDKNPFYSELTGLYWMWKNGEECDITGLCHYRRYFLNEKGEVLSQTELENILGSFDVIVTGRLQYQDTNLYEQYGIKHYVKDLDLTRDAIERLYPDYLQTYDSVINGKEMYFANMIVAGKNVVDSYAKWLFDVLFDVEKHLDMTGYDDYNRRVYGFIAERLLMVYVKHNRLRAFECQVGLTESKAETIKALEESKKLLEKGDSGQVLAYLNDVMSKRPDAFYKDADVEGNLGLVYTFAEIMQVEKQAGMNNLAGALKDFDRLKDMSLEFSKILVNETDRLYDYIVDNNLSVFFVLVMLPKVLENNQDMITVYNILANKYLDNGNIDMARIYVNEALKLGQ